MGDYLRDTELLLVVVVQCRMEQVAVEVPGRTIQSQWRRLNNALSSWAMAVPRSHCSLTLMLRQRCVAVVRWELR